MKRMNIYAAVMTIALMMASINLNAQPRARHGGMPPHARQEMRMHHGGPRHHGGPAMHTMGRPVAAHHMHAMPMHHRVDAHGYLPGWHGRVRYLNGRWGYLRDSRWYWYDTYFAPDYYYAHPVGHFHAHFHGHDAVAVAGGVAAGIAVGALIHALAR